ncbi:MAG: hypothetical protein BWX95_02163 [Bacteroidetes bacterium ADurb.Bin141]|nr:MAG: hypothetical protein BWX95_02163 [Bacteroidetes bacterium ADurb.Bin141]
MDGIAFWTSMKLGRHVRLVPDQVRLFICLTGGRQVNGVFEILSIYNVSGKLGSVVIGQSEQVKISREGGNTGRLVRLLPSH